MSLKSIQDKLPDFLIIGAGKSGTTSINNYIKQHPEIFIPEKKEPNFFAYETIERNSILEDKDLCKHYDNSITNIEDYINLFKDAKEGLIKGETSNIYMYNKDAPLRIKYYIPTAKFIAIFRNPVDRLISRYLHLCRENLNKGINFDDIFNKNSIWWNRPDLIQEGFYHKNLSNFMRYFDRHQFLLLLYDDLIDDQAGVLKKIFEFLDVNPKYKPNTTIAYNKSGLIRNKFIHPFIDGKSIIHRTLKKIFPSTYKKAKKSIWIQQLFYSLKSKNLYKPQIDADLRMKILNSIYKDDILAFQDIIKRDLTHWMEK